MLDGKSRKLTWTSFDMPLMICTVTTTDDCTAQHANGTSAVFVYGPEHQRTRQTRGDGSVVVYAGSQEVETVGGQVTVKTYWPGGIGVEIDRPMASETEMNWTHADRLGSMIGLTDAASVLREKLAYDAWGKRRTLTGLPTSGSAKPDSINGVTDNRGFTDHEMLDQLDLVHMNGRVYEPMIGRFLSGDPHITDPMNGQNYNRYSYVLNNPTNLTDPTGFDEVDNTLLKNEIKVDEHGLNDESGKSETKTDNSNKAATDKGGRNAKSGGGDSTDSIGSKNRDLSISGRDMSGAYTTATTAETSVGPVNYITGHFGPSQSEISPGFGGGQGIGGPNFFSLSTFEGAKRNISLDQAVNRGQPFRKATGPVIIGATLAPFVGSGIVRGVPAAYAKSVEAKGKLVTWNGIIGAARAISKGMGGAADPLVPESMSLPGLQQSVKDSASLRDMIRSEKPAQVSPPKPVDVTLQ